MSSITDLLLDIRGCLAAELEFLLLTTDRIDMSVKVGVETIQSPSDQSVWQLTILLLFVLITLSGAATAESAQTTAGERPRIGLALSGGGARGAAHLGVLQILERERIPIDFIAGTSMGSIVGGMYASGMSPEEIQTRLVAVDWDDVFHDKINRKDRSFRRKSEDRLWLIENKPGFNKGKIELPPGLVQGQKISNLLTELTLNVSDIDDFDELAIPFRAVATDIRTGEKVVLGSGNLATAIRASMSIPAAMSPVPWGDMMLVDGGIASNLPIETVRAMGADIIIAVDISTPLKDENVAQSVLSIAGQLTGFLTRRNVAAEISTLGERDVLIIPDLGDIASAQFDRIDEAVPTGLVAAQAQVATLREFALNEQAYRAYVAAHSLRTSELPTIEFVHFENESKLPDEFFLARLDLARTGQTLDVKRLEKVIDELYGLELFSNISYQLVEEDGEYGIEVHVVPKSWGPNYLQFGTELRSSFHGEGIFNVTASLLKTELNSWNGEWRTGVSIGVEPGFVTDFYQPIGITSRWFVGTSLLYDQFNINVFQPDTNNIVEQAGIKQFAGSVYGGRDFGTWGRGILTYSRGSGERSVRIGDPDIDDQDFDIGELSFALEVDELDDLYFPTSGYIARAIYKTNKSSLGSDEDYDQVLIRAGAATSWGKNTFEAGGDYRTTFNGDAPAERRFRGGGLFNFSGLEFNQISGQQYGRLIGTYRREILEIGLGKLWAGTSIEYGNVWEDRDDMKFNDGIFAGSLFLGAETVLGPLFFGYGLAEGGASSFYLYLGPVRDGPALR